MIWCSQYSQFWEKHALRFIVICGIFLLYASGVLNLSTTASMRFNWLFFEPFVFMALTFIDNQGMLSAQQAGLLYLALTMWLVVKYLLFMGAVVDQITSFMGLRFLHVKPKHALKNQ
jgi:hypothetical protein